MTSVSLYPHQKDVLEQTQDKKPIKGFEGLYCVDEKGNVFSMITNRSRRMGILKPYEKNGYLAVNLYNGGKLYHRYIHRLVAEAFIPNPNEYKEVNHIDCDKKNNSIHNLEWVNRKKNLKHAYENGLKRTGENHGMHKLNSLDVINIRRSNESQNTLAKQYNISQSTISAIKRFKLWKEVMPDE